MVPIENINREASADSAVEGLLEFAGSREQTLDLEDFALVRDAALLVWMRQTRARRNRRIAGGFALLAAAILLVVALRPRMLSVDPVGVTVASVESIWGDLEVQNFGGWEKLAPGQRIEAGRTLRTHGGPARLEAFGVTVRVAEGARLAFQENSSVYLERGRVFVDTGSDQTVLGQTVLSQTVPDQAVRGSRLGIETRFGRVVDIGTQFEVNMGEQGEELAVRVREGSVRLITDGSEEALVARAGQQLRRNSSGEFEVSSSTVYGETWAWILKASRPFDLHGTSLADYLDWLEIETGWRVEFDSALVEQEVKSTVLSGSSTAGQPANETAESVLASAGFEFEVNDGVLTIR